jgi:prevent-host-death family protein
MKSVGLFDAKTRLSEIVRDAEGGEPTIILRNGRPVAQIVPIAPAGKREFGFDDGLGYIGDDFDAPLPPDVMRTFVE